jgi:Domain of unknown function (DUF4138)
MKRVFAFLTGCALLSRPGHATAQGGVAFGPGLRQLSAAAMRAPPEVEEAVMQKYAAGNASEVKSVAEERAMGKTAPDTVAAGTAKSSEANRALLKACCEKIIKDWQRIYYLNNRNGKMKLQIRGIYTRGEAIFFSLRLTNRSPLDYDVDSIRFFLTQKEKGVHPAPRVKTVSPVYVYDSATLIKGYGRVNSVIVLPRLTLGKGKRLLIEVLEKNGERQLQVQASNFTLENAKLI